MLNIKFIRENADRVKKSCENKQVKVDIDKLLKIDRQRRKIMLTLDGFRAKKNKANKDIIAAKDEKSKKKIISEMRKIDKQSDKTKKQFQKIDAEYNEIMLLVPNVYSKDTPIGVDDTYNKEVYKSGKIPKFDFPIKDHIQIGKDLDLIDIERGVKTSGFRGYYLKNEAVLLQFALMQFAFDKLRKKGFVVMIPPTILRENVLIGSGHFPEAKAEIYQIANPGRLASGEEVKEKFFLGGTSEPALLAYYADTILDEKKLPIKLAGFSSCYRSEAGSYGKDTKGLYRLHEFMKIEQVIFCRADLEESHKLFDEIGGYAKEILEELKLPYRVVQVCTGDMGAGKYEMQDVETWMPSRDSYGETHSDSALTDWQARRMNIKYRIKNNEKKFVYTLNNTMIASPRILIAILENYQQKDGSVLIPKVLQKYIGINKIEKRDKKNELS
jgi:seryl-tRNA synthetase